MSEKWVPHPYQMKGIQTLVCQAGAGLLFDPGMGKTSVALAAFEALRDVNYAEKMLVIAPIKPMYGTWRQEAEKWEDFQHLTFSVIHGDALQKAEALNTEADIYLINPEGLKWLYSLYKGQLPKWDVLCVDESTKFKNSQSQRFKLLRKQMHKFRYRWILTGTFVPNGLQDVFAQVFVMDMGHHLGKYITHFRNQYFISSGYGGYTYIPIRGAYEEVAEKISHMTMKLDAEDYLDMPELAIIPRPIDLPDSVMAVYKEVENHFITELHSGMIVAANSGAAGTKCRQIANGAVYDEFHEAHFVHDAKTKGLEEIVEETNGNPLFIVYEYQHDLEAIKRLLGDDMVCITGITGEKLESILERFNNGTIPYLVAHWGSTHGINIQGSCYHMVAYGLTWNLEHYIQTIWRLYRQGQVSRQVLVYLLVARNTLDEEVAAVIDHKQNNQDKFEKRLMEYHPSD